MENSITVIVPDWIKAGLKKAAQEDMLKMSDLARLYIRDGLAQRGIAAPAEKS